MTRPAVSVLTPVWNRAHLLPRLYESLRRQTLKNFEWIVVDDGSTDGASALVRRWAAEAGFPISCFSYANNRGKLAALNSGKKLVSGKYTLLIDSDDALLDDAMETVSRWIGRTGFDADPQILGLAFRYIDDFGRPVGFPFAAEAARMGNREARYRSGINFDVMRLVKTRILQCSDFMELDGGEHVPEVLFWNGVSDRGETVYVDCAVGKCFTRHGGARLSDGDAGAVKWPRGNYLLVLSVLNEDMRRARLPPKVLLNAARKITRLGLHVGRSPYRQFRDLAHARARLLWAAGMPGGLAGYARDRLRGRRAPKADPDISAWGPAAPPENPELHPPPERFGRPRSPAVETGPPPGIPRR